MQKYFEFDVKGSTSLNVRDADHASLNLIVGEVKSPNPKNAAIDKAVTQLLKRLYLVAYAADATGLSKSGSCSGIIFTSFISETRKCSAKKRAEKMTTKVPWKKPMPAYSFHVSISTST